MTSIINNQPLQVPVLRIEPGYTKAKVVFGPGKDFDLSAVGTWVKEFGAPKTTAVYTQHIYESFLAEILPLSSGLSYDLSIAFLDDFILGSPTLLQSQYQNVNNALTISDYIFETYNPVLVTAHQILVGGNDIGNPAASIVVSTTGYADLLEIQAKEVGSVDTWVPVYSGAGLPEVSFSLFAGQYNIRYRSKLVFSDLDSEQTDWVIYPEVIESEGTVGTPNLPTNVAKVAFKDEGFVATYRLKVNWEFDQAGGGLKRHFNVQILPNPSAITALDTLNWSQASTVVTSEPTYTFDPFPYRKIYAIRIEANGWGELGSGYIYASAYISENPAESGVLGYLSPSVDEYPDDTKIQVTDDYIRGYKVFDVNNPSNNILTFEYNSSTGNVAIGAPGTYADGQQVTVPFLFDATNSRLQISGKTITDSIISADYVMGWLGGVAPTFRTANKSSFGDNLSGIWMGYEDSNTFKVDIGDSSKYIRWDGTNLVISGNVTVEGGGTLGQTQKQVFVFTRSSTAPLTPTGGSYASPIPAGGWSLTIPAGTDTVYMASRLFTSDGLPPQDSNWSTPSVFSQDTPAAKTLSISSTAQVFTFNSVLQPDPTIQTITFTANTQNISSDITWSSNPVGLVSGTGTSKQLTVANFGTNSSVYVQATSEGITDSITIVKVQDGVGGLSGSLTNESHSVPADSTGVVIGGFTNAGGTFEVYRGSEVVTSSAAFSIVAPATKNGLTISINSLGVYSLSGTWLDSSTSETFKLRATIDGSVIDKVYSITKALAGTVGDIGTRGPGGFSREAPAGSLTTAANWDSTNTSSAVYLALGDLNPPVEKDVVTLWNSTGSLTRVRSGLTWVDFNFKIHGNLLVDGTVRAQHVNADILTSKSLTAYFIETRPFASTGTPRVTLGAGSTGFPIEVFGNSNQALLGFDSQGVLTLTGGLGPNTIKNLNAFEPSILNQLLPAAGTGGFVQLAGGDLSGVSATNITITLPSANSNTAAVSYSLSDISGITTNSSSTSPYTVPSWSVVVRRGSSGGPIVASNTYAGSLITQQQDTSVWTHRFSLNVSDTIEDSSHGTGDGSPLTYVLVITRVSGSYNSPKYQEINLSVPTNGGGATNLGGLNDVSIVGATNGQVLTYNSATFQWENQDSSGGGTTAWADITGIPVFATRWPTWAEVTDKPVSFTPSAHTHAWADITSGIPVFATRWPSFSEVTGSVADAGGVLTTRTLTAGDGLTGGGTLAANRTFAVDSTVVRNSGTWPISVTGDAAFLSIPDTRSTNSSPSSLSTRQFRVEFKNNSAVGSPPTPSSGSYSHVMTIAGWTDGSGGWPQQLVVSSGGISFRQGTGTSSWSSWNSTVNTEGNQNIAGTKTFNSTGTGGSLHVNNTTSNSPLIAFYSNTSSRVGMLGFSTARVFNVWDGAGTSRLSVSSSGIATAADFVSTSDIRTKRNLNKITNSLDRLCNNLVGYTFERNDTPGIVQAGYIAQDLEKALPEGVSEVEGIKRVSNSAVIALIIEAIKELKINIDEIRGNNGNY